MIVADTNIIAYLYLTGERSAQAESAFRKDPDWTAPVLWRSEFRNVLAYYIRKSILTVEDVYQVMESAARQMRGNEYEVPSLKVLSLADSSTCSAYGCEFVALAQELNATLVTVDKQILEQFPGIAVSLDQFVQ